MTQKFDISLPIAPGYMLRIIGRDQESLLTMVNCDLSLEQLPVSTSTYVVSEDDDEDDILEQLFGDQVRALRTDRCCAIPADCGEDFCPFAEVPDDCWGASAVEECCGQASPCAYPSCPEYDSQVEVLCPACGSGPCLNDLEDELDLEDARARSAEPAYLLKERLRSFTVYYAEGPVHGRGIEFDTGTVVVDIGVPAYMLTFQSFSEAYRQLVQDGRFVILFDN